MTARRIKADKRLFFFSSIHGVWVRVMLREVSGACWVKENRWGKLGDQGEGRGRCVAVRGFVDFQVVSRRGKRVSEVPACFWLLSLGRPGLAAAHRSRLSHGLNWSIHLHTHGPGSDSPWLQSVSEGPQIILPRWL
jgi:hypothetical protein